MLDRLANTEIRRVLHIGEDELIAWINPIIADQHGLCAVVCGERRAERSRRTVVCTAVPSASTPPVATRGIAPGRKDHRKVFSRSNGGRLYVAAGSPISRRCHDVLRAAVVFRAAGHRILQRTVIGDGRKPKCPAPGLRPARARDGAACPAHEQTAVQDRSSPSDRWRRRSPLSGLPLSRQAAITLAFCCPMTSWQHCEGCRIVVLERVAG